MAMLAKSVARNRVFSFLGVSLTSLSVAISKDGAAFASPAGTLSQITGNYYKLALDTSDVDTLGDLAYKFSDTILGVIAPNGENVDQVVLATTVDPVTGGVLLGEHMPDGTTPMAHGGTPGSSEATLGIQSFEINNPDGDAFTLNSDSGTCLNLLSNSGYGVQSNTPGGNFLFVSSGRTAIDIEPASGYDGISIITQGMGTPLSLNSDGGPAFYLGTQSGPTVRMRPIDANGIDILPTLNLNARATAINAVGAGTGKDIDANLFGTTQDFVTALTESYAADGAAPTPAQAIFQILSFLFERSVSSTTITCKKIDGTTTSMTFTINSATTPTSQTRAT